MIGCLMMAAVITPALVLVRQQLEMGREIARYQAMETFAASYLEQALAQRAADFHAFTMAGAVAGTAFSDLRYSVVGSTAPGDGGVSEKLLAVTSTVWRDEDSDTVLDNDEERITLASKLARMTQYEELAE